jgi:hypothetical protein
MSIEEVTVHAFRRHLPGSVLDAVLTQVEMKTVGRAGPGATQSKPDFSWFIVSNDRGPSKGSRARAKTLATLNAAPHPAVGW